MKKNELLKAVANTTEGKFTQKDVDEILVTFSDVVVDTLKKDKNEKITLANLGTFSSKHVAEKSGVSAINGKPWHKDEHDEIVFKVSKPLKNI